MSFPFFKQSFQDLIVEIASKEIGVQEIGNTNCGPRVNQYKAATDYHEGPEAPWPWCAAFVCWVIEQAAQEYGLQMHAGYVHPRTARAYSFEQWSLEQDETTWLKKPTGGDILPGDIVIFTFSHIGFASSKPNKDGTLLCIEGNTNEKGSNNGGMVLEQPRKLSQIRSRIRYRV